MIRGFLICAAGLQILLGLVYIGKNSMVVPQFRDTTIYLEMAERFVADEYTGLLYPLLLKACRYISLLPYQVPVYLVQLFAAFGSVFYLVYSWTEKKSFSLFCALWMNTIPFVVQVHMTVLPHSLAMSCMVLMITPLLCGSREQRALRLTEWAELFCGFVLVSQLDRAYLVPGLLMVIWGSFLQLYRKESRVLWFAIGLFIGIGMLVVNLAVYKIVQTPGYYGRMQRSFASAFFQRTGVLTLNNNYMIYMPEEVGDCFEGLELNRIAKYPYQIETVFGPTLEACYGAERAGEIYMELGLLGLKSATKANIRAIAEDAIGYALPLATYVSWQDGTLKGSSSWNYQQFMAQSPKLFVAYARISVYVWLLCFVLSVLTGILCAVVTKKHYLRVVCPLLLFIGLYALHFALEGTGVFDYKTALLPMLMSYTPIAFWVYQFLFYEV